MLPQPDEYEAVEVGKLSLRDRGVLASRPLFPGWPTSLRGWVTLFRDSLITDVLRRCHRKNCWKRARYSTLFSGRFCGEHFTEFYSDPDDPPATPPAPETEMRQILSTPLALDSRRPPMPPSPSKLRGAPKEKHVEHAGDQLMALYGFQIIRFSQARATNQTPGIPDRKYYHTGRKLTLWWEAKRPGGKQSHFQESFQAMCEACGETYLCGTVDVLRNYLIHMIGAKP